MSCRNSEVWWCCMHWRRHAHAAHSSDRGWTMLTGHREQYWFTILLGRSPVTRSLPVFLSYRKHYDLTEWMYTIIFINARCYVINKATSLLRGQMDIYIYLPSTEFVIVLNENWHLVQIFSWWAFNLKKMRRCGNIYIYKHPSCLLAEKTWSEANSWQQIGWASEAC